MKIYLLFFNTILILFIATECYSQSFDNLFKNTKYGDVKYNSKNTIIINKEINNDWVYYVLMKTKIDAKKDKLKKSAVFPKNYNVEILIEDNGWFLIKTPFGLTGWISKNDIVVYPSSKETFIGLFMHGD